MEKRCDLHIHSSFSDSDAQVKDIFAEAHQKGLRCIAISDHDTIAGLSYAHRWSKEFGVELVEGIEISAQEEAAEVHVLGYFVDYSDESFCETLSHIHQVRYQRLLAMIDKLNGLGLEINRQEVLAKVDNGIATRLHLALHLVEKNIVKSVWDAFSRYLSPGRPAYVEREKYSVKESIEVIHSGGGLAFLAHPHFLPDQSWIERFAPYGVDGMEVVYPRLSPRKTALYASMADSLGLLKSGGSDAHGSYKNFTHVGAVTIPYAWIEEMKRCKATPCS